jgi:hypothetical protein
MGFIWLELFSATTPRNVGLALLGYTMLNLAAAAFFGAKAGFTTAILRCLLSPARQSRP